MSEETNTDEDTGDDDPGQENELIRSLRSQIDESNREAKAARENTAIAVEAVKAEVARTAKAQTLVNEFGYPGLAETIASNVEGELTEESVAEAFGTLGLAKQEVPEPSGGSVPKTPAPDAAGVEAVADLGSQVASAASGEQAGSLEERLAAATTVEEVTALAAEGEFLQQ